MPGTGIDGAKEMTGGIGMSGTGTDGAKEMTDAIGGFHGVGIKRL
jgi:hypothetical protein